MDLIVLSITFYILSTTFRSKYYTFHCSPHYIYGTISITSQRLS